jgi:hypothetical protein
VREDSDIEVIFDAEFRRRFTELINQVIEPERTDHDARFWKSADLRRLHQ